jgi:hypothetical protein
MLRVRFVFPQKAFRSFQCQLQVGSPAYPIKRPPNGETQICETQILIMLARTSFTCHNLLHDRGREGSSGATILAEGPPAPPIKYVKSCREETVRSPCLELKLFPEGDYYCADFGKLSISDSPEVVPLFMVCSIRELITGHKLDSS